MWKFNHCDSKRNFFDVEKIFILFFFISLLFPSTAIAQQTSNNLSELEELEIKKLQIETNKSSYEERFYEVTFWIKILGSILGGIAIIWTIIKGIDTISQKTKEQSLKKISSLLESLSSESEYARLAAAKGLTLYADSVVDEILTAISIEKSDIVKNALENALYKITDNNMKKVIDSNNEALIRRPYLFGRLTEAGIEKEQIAARLSLTQELIKIDKEQIAARPKNAPESIITTKDGYVNYRYGTNIQRLHMKRQEIIESSQGDLDDGIKSLFEETKIVGRLTESTGKLIAKWIRDERKIGWPKTGLDLSETNLNKVKLKKVDASYSIFSFSIMRNSNLNKSTLCKSNFSFSDLYDTCMDNADFSKANLMGCRLISSSGKYANFYKAYLADAIFSKGDFSNAKFVESKAYKVKFHKTKLTNAIFNECSLLCSEFQEADLEGASFNNLKMYRSKLIEANLKKSSMKDVHLNGADLRGATFVNANLQNVDFRGANIKNADFTGANIEKNVKFGKCKGVGEAIFDNNSKDRIKFTDDHPKNKNNI